MVLYCDLIREGEFWSPVVVPVILTMFLKTQSFGSVKNVKMPLCEKLQLVKFIFKCTKQILNKFQIPTHGIFF